MTRTVLVADDSPLVRLALTKALRAAGFAVVEAASLLEARGVDPSQLAAAVFDLDLGDGTGLDAARELASKSPALPFVFFSSEEDSPLARDARGRATVFRKPDELDRVVAWVCSLYGAGQP